MHYLRYEALNESPCPRRMANTGKARGHPKRTSYGDSILKVRFSEDAIQEVVRAWQLEVLDFLVCWARSRDPQARICYDCRCSLREQTSFRGSEKRLRTCKEISCPFRSVCHWLCQC